MPDTVEAAGGGVLGAVGLLLSLQPPIAKASVRLTCIPIRVFGDLVDLRSANHSAFKD
jgi:hypothetical protein